ncbi:UDP-4-amino-4,6-dideoxy-N-acetyl-beta-L-altrosamine N-acetyltransferase [Idiomarina sp.]|uniref:UDP-4-amino-4, 6-dideoxy-N-acetyl-beta-L-altrosamine N-acetyltransferase n=1 Tax=Idiomarina sp. TaxID=1874361 RepID=UPI00261697C5|nr:UDP-4-amino-4,6-dideoxy-N-acetyl-beta-L-altrosamine N-acetyltransferase [Idiomarina sp.]
MPLRAIKESDLETILKWRNSDAVRLNMFSQATITFERHRAWFFQMQQDTSSVWWLYECGSGKASGVVYFTDVDMDSGICFWGFYVAPDSKKGIGSEMGREALNRAFAELGTRKVYGDVLEFNERSQRFHEKLGFEREGCMREHHKLDNAYYDVIRYGLLKSEWNGNGS